MRRALAPLVALGLLAGMTVPASAQNINAENSYTVTVLQSNESDSNLVNGWGITASATSPWWVSNNGTSTSTLYDGTGAPRPLVVTIPGPPTGTVFNGSSDFKVDAGTGLVVSRFLFATDDGRIAGWNGVGTAAIQAAATPGAIYLGLAIGSSGGHNYLYAGNFVDARVDVFNATFGLELRGAETLNVTGRVISPGFIDILADNSTSPESTYPIFEKYKVSDGVTTALQMHGGSPDCGAYYRYFSNRPHSINYGVSTFVMAIRARAGAGRQIEKNLAEGALGVSHSLEYQPAPYAEMLEYAKLAKKYERPMFLHLRYSSSDKELDGVDEAIRLARDSGARLHIDHLHSTGGTFHMEQALEKIRTANAQGLTITTCVYPYSFWATYLSNNRFGPGWQQRYGLTYEDLRIVGTPERLTARSFAHYRKTSALAAVPEGTMPLEKTVNLALKEDFCMFGSDGGIQFEPRANSHPRGAGCFATAIRHGLEIGMPLEKILHKMTALPRSVVTPALKDRGVLEDGAVADLTVFDPEAIRGNATIENPNQTSSGIDLVIVNGKIAYKDGKQLGKNGVAIKS